MTDETRNTQHATPGDEFRVSSHESRSLIVLGIDPGLSVTGYGLILSQEGDLRPLDYGAWRLPQGTSRSPALPGPSVGRPVGPGRPAPPTLPERLQWLHEAIVGVIATHHPQEVAIEDFYVGHARAAVTIGEVRAMALLAAAQSGLPVHLYKPLEVKQFVTSYGHGSKEQVQEMVRLLLNLERVPEPEDAADALAVAICHCLKRESPLSSRERGRVRARRRVL